jgi:hypothetical protein
MPLPTRCKLANSSTRMITMIPIPLTQRGVLWVDPACIKLASKFLNP